MNGTGGECSLLADVTQVVQQAGGQAHPYCGGQVVVQATFCSGTQDGPKVPVARS